jgi:predicted nucleic acid-binding protein
VSAIHIADTGFFVALGNPSKERYQRVRTFARRNDLVFVVPERVYEELTSADSSERLTAEPIPVDVAIDEGWVRVADPLEYTNPLVSKTMDDIQRYIASVDDRPEDEIERADPALGALTAQSSVRVARHTPTSTRPISLLAREQRQFSEARGTRIQ